MPKKSGKVLMMVKAANLGWAGVGAGKKQGWSREEAGQDQEQGQKGQKQGRAGAGPK